MTYIRGFTAPLVSVGSGNGLVPPGNKQLYKYIYTHKCKLYVENVANKFPHLDNVFTHWGREKIAAILQTGFSNAVSFNENLRSLIKI